VYCLFSRKTKYFCEFWPVTEDASTAGRNEESSLRAILLQVLQRVAACCSVMQCVVVCCSVLQCVAECFSVLQCCGVLRYVAA